MEAVDLELDSENWELKRSEWGGRVGGGVKTGNKAERETQCFGSKHCDFLHITPDVHQEVTQT